ncbi:MAG: 50S ribosomal protein L9, partial [Chloroflexi bacterium]|nr:50S ribosomal protein L9 [Chloroflexota bacterium]
MKVVFMEEVEGTARVGEVKNVADGFARNYLLPRRLAAPATDHYITIAAARAKKEVHRQTKLDEEAQEHMVPKMESQSITIEVRVGEQGKLFGSVTARDIAEALQEATSVELEHRQVDLRQPIREVGSQEVTIKLTRNVHVPVTVNVEPLGGIAEEEPAEAEAAVVEPEVAAVTGEEPDAAEEPETEAEASVEEPAEEEKAEAEAEPVEAEEKAEEAPEAAEETSEEPEAAEEPAEEEKVEAEAEPVEAEEKAEEAPEAAEETSEEAEAAEEPEEAEAAAEEKAEEAPEAAEEPEEEEKAEAEDESVEAEEKAEEAPEAAEETSEEPAEAGTEE